MSAPNNMRPPTGVVANSMVVVDTHDYLNRQHNKRPFIGGNISDKIYRVLQHDIVWARRPKISLGRSERAHVQSEVRGFSVLNRSGKEGQTEDSFYQEHRIVGISVMNMEVHAIKTDANIRVTVTLKGPTWMWNNNPDEIIHAGDIVAARIPSSSADAERRANALAPPEGGTPTQRYTAFPTKWDPSHVSKAIRRDLGRFLRAPQAGVAGDERPHVIPSTPDLARSIRTAVLLGIAIATAADRQGQIQASPTDFINSLRDMAGGGNDQVSDMVNNVMRGNLDEYIAALLAPVNGERVVGQARLPPQTAEPVRHLHDMQTSGLENLITTVEGSVTATGRGRILGRAITNGPPGEVFGILLFGS